MNNRVIKNASWMIGCKIAQSVISLIIGMLTARYLGPSNYGLISYAASIAVFLLPLMQLGLSKTLVQEFIKRPDREGEVLGTALVFNVMSAIACMGGMYAFLSVANAGESTTILVGVLYSFSLLFQATEIVQYWFQAKLLSKYPSIASVISYTIVALYKVYLLVTGKSVIWFSVSSTLDYLLISVILLIVYKRMGNQKLKFSWRLGMEMLHSSKYYIVASMMVSVFQQTDRIMLKLMMNEAETGYYSSAITCVSVTAFVFAAIVDSMRPPILEAKHDGSDAYEPRIIQLYSVITYASLIQSVFMVLLARPIVLILYGEQYLPSVTSLRVAVWYVTFSNYGSVRNIWMLAENKQKYLWIINLSGALANVALNAALIPLFGAVGAAAASLVTQFFTNVVIGFILRPVRYNNRLMIRGLDPKPLFRYLSSIIKQLRKKLSRKRD
ncbi:MAG: flippase [Ruminococcus sp.]|nr:flippase [Ruminococcus sp.]